MENFINLIERYRLLATERSVSRMHVTAPQNPTLKTDRRSFDPPSCADMKFCQDFLSACHTN